MLRLPNEELFQRTAYHSLFDQKDIGKVSRTATTATHGFSGLVVR